MRNEARKANKETAITRDSTQKGRIHKDTMEGNDQKITRADTSDNATGRN